MADANFIGSCIACRFFVAPQGAFGVCRRYPSFQNVHQNDWCGEFQLNEKHFEQPVEDKPKRGRKPKVQE